MSARDWHVHVGDPTLFGWAVTVAYFAVAALCLLAAVAAARDAGWWRGLALVLVLLGFNKQLDLQTLAVAYMRDWARNGGWYRQRRDYQYLLLTLLAVAAFFVATWLIATHERRSRWARWSSVGALGLIAFLGLRAVSLHSVDQALRLPFAGARLYEMVELGAIVVIGYAASRVVPMRRRFKRARMLER